MAEPLPEPQKEGAAPLPSEAPATKAPARPILREFHAKLLAVLFFMALVSLLLIQVPWASESTSASQNQTTPPLAELMFEDHGESFVLLSLVMGVAIIGGLFLAKEDPAEDTQKPENEAQGEKDVPSEALEGKDAAHESGEEKNERGESEGKDADGKGGEAV